MNGMDWKRGWEHMTMPRFRWWPGGDGWVGKGCSTTEEGYQSLAHMVWVALEGLWMAVG